jgi:serine/threonine protein kinase
LVEENRQFGKYTLHRVIARGGMGEVWAAHFENHLGKRCDAAVKVTLSQFDDASSGQRWIDEVRLSSALAHKNIVRVFDAGFERGTPYLAMEMLDGLSLRELAVAHQIGAQRIPQAVLLRVCIDVARGLHAAHESKSDSGVPLNVVHRDIAPANIFVCSNGTTKILDFGIARFALQRSAHTASGRFLGRARYASPEQAFQQPLDRRSDVFSLACVLYEGLCGRTPYDFEDEQETLRALMSGAPIEPIAQADSRLMQLVLQSLSFSRQSRPPTAEGFANALETLENVAPHEAVAEVVRTFNRHKPIESKPKASDNYRRKRIFAAVASVCALAVGIVTFAATRRQVDAKENVSTLQVTPLEPTVERSSAEVGSIEIETVHGDTRAQTAPAPSQPSSDKTPKRKTPAASTLPNNPYRQKP